MPSPIAHAAVGLWLAPRPGTPEAIVWSRRPAWRKALALAVVAWCCVLPDMDVPLGWLAGYGPFEYHGYAGHSLVWALPAGLLIGPVLARVLGIPWARGGLAVAVLWVAHVVMDSFGAGRGVALFWPVYPQRLSMPLTLFVGLEYSELWNWAKHSMTLLNEGLFAGVVATMVWWRGRGRPTEKSLEVMDTAEGGPAC